MRILFLLSLLGVMACEKMPSDQNQVKKSDETTAEAPCDDPAKDPLKEEKAPNLLQNADSGCKLDP